MCNALEYRHAAQASPRSAAPGIPAVPDTGAFWRSRTFAELQEEEGTTGRVDPADMALPDLTAEEREAFVAESEDR